MQPPLFWNLVCWTHQPFFPSAVIVNPRLPPFPTYFNVRSVRQWAVLQVLEEQPVAGLMANSEAPTVDVPIGYRITSAALWGLRYS
jgi:hypothetical protein